MVKIALIIGSVRHDRQGIKVARWMEQKLKDRNHAVFFIDPIDINLPLLDRMYKEMTNPSEKLIDLHDKINAVEGYMPITPEYNHSTSAAMKNTLDYFLEEYYFKPSAIVSYSPGGFGGINAAQQMRLIFAELRAPSIPSSLPISKVNEVFDEAKSNNFIISEKQKGLHFKCFYCSQVCSSNNDRVQDLTNNTIQSER